MGKKHNGVISFWKFMFSMLIVALHLGIKHPEVRYNFNSGSIGVEFFFIVSGYLFCHKCLKTEDKEIGKKTISFIKNKIQRFLPYFVFLCLISIPYVVIIEKYKIDDITLAFYNLLYLPTQSKYTLDIFAITWYIAAMILVEWLLYPLLVKYKKTFIYCISPLIIYFGTCYLVFKYGKLAIPWMPNIICYSGFIRALVGINIGLITYLIGNRIKEINFNKLACSLITLFEIFGYLSIFVICNKYNAHVRFDLLMVIFLAISISFSFSTKTLFYNIANNRLFYTLEKLTLPIYLNQWAIIIMVERYIKHYNIAINYYYELVVIILILMIVAIIEEIIISFYEKRKYIIKKLFITS